jgi:hypothetical protein
MQRKVVIFGSLAVLVGAGLLLIFWRMQIMGPDAKRTAGGLLAVNAQGTPIPMPPAQATAAAQHPNGAFQVTNGLMVALELEPYPPSMSQASQFKVTLADTQGRAIGGATISVDLTMPGMYMPPNKIDLAASGGGEYMAEGHFTMRGPWRMEVIITLNEQTQSVFFDVWL